MSLPLEVDPPCIESREAATAQEVALTWLHAAFIQDAEVESVARPSLWTAEVYYRRSQSFWVLACMCRGRVARVVETPIGIEGLLLLTHTDEGWAVTETQAILPPELLCGDAELYIPGGAKTYDRILLSGHPERYGLRSPRFPVW